MYGTGEGVPKDDVEAVRWYRRWGDPAVVADSILVVDCGYRSSRYFGHSQSGNPIDSPDNGPDPIVLVRGV
jgi:hypothetical protein